MQHLFQYMQSRLQMKKSLNIYIHTYIHTRLLRSLKRAFQQQFHLCRNAQPFPFITPCNKIFLLQLLQPEIESHIHSEMQIHLDLVCAKLRDTKERLDLACTKLKNTEKELRNANEHLKDFKETTKKHEERINALENKPFIYTWKINCFHRILEEAKTGNVVRIQSDPFYTSECGYKGGLRLYPNGSSLGKKHSHVDLLDYNERRL